MQPGSDLSWRTYPGLLIAGSFAAGILLAESLSESFWSWWVGVLASTLFLISLHLLKPRRLVTTIPLWRTAGTGVLLVTFGGLVATFSTLLPAHHVAREANEAREHQVILAGRVADVPVADHSGLRFQLDVQQRLMDSTAVGASGRVQVVMWASSEDSTRHFALRKGDAVRVAGRLQPVPSKRNPADFDYGRFLSRRGIYATLTVDEPTGMIQRVGSSTGLTALIARLRVYVRQHIMLLVPSVDSQSVLRALVLGERHGIDAHQREHFIRSGLLHLLAVSGLHVLLVGMVLYRLLRPLLLRVGLSWLGMELLRTGLTAILLVLFMMLTGMRASVVRAVVMAVLFMGSTVLQRNAHSLNTLGVAAFVLLLARPSHLFEAGFQLSFAAVAGIVSLDPLFSGWLPPALLKSSPMRYVSRLFTVSLAATTSTLPVLLYHFGYVSFAGLVLNAAAIPLTMLALGGILIALLLAGWFMPAALVFGSAADWLVRGLLQTAAFGHGAFSWASVERYVRDPFLLGALVAFLIMMIRWSQPARRWRAGAAVMLLLAASLWGQVLREAHRPRLEAVFFDVGQGDATLLRLPNQRHVLIDAGVRNDFTDQGKRTLLPHLIRYGISHLDAVVITHPHSDHLGGLPSLLRSVSIGEVVHNGHVYSSALYAETMRLLDSLNVEHRAVQAGDTLGLDSSVRIQVLAPFSPTPSAASDANDHSLALRVTYQKTSFLFAGDVEAPLEQRIAATYGPLLESDVVKVAHHGSPTSSIPVFVRRALPDTSAKSIAVVSVGKSNSFGLPGRGVLRRWHERGATLWITGHQGALWLRSDGRKVEQVTWR